MKEGRHGGARNSGKVTRLILQSPTVDRQVVLDIFTATSIGRTLMWLCLLQNANRELRCRTEHSFLIVPRTGPRALEGEEAYF